MSQRKVLKDIILFGKREFKEKKPISVEILRVKSKTILTRGVLPSLSVKQVKGAKYLVVADYREIFRIYSFSIAGKLLGGQNLEKTAKLLKTLKKGTVKEYALPKRLPKLTLGEISAHYQKQFNKAQQSLNDTLGLKIKYLFSITAVNNLKGVNIEEFIAQKDEEVLKIDAEYHKVPEYEIIAYRELINYYLINTGIFLKEKYLKEFCYFIVAILLRGEKAQKVLDLLLKSKDFTILSEGYRFPFLKYINEMYSQKELKIFLQNIFSTIELLCKYKILIELNELSFFIRFFYFEFLKIEYTKSHLKVKDTEELLREILLEFFTRKYGHIKNIKELSENKEKLSTRRNFLKIVYLVIIFSILSKKYRFINELKSNYPYLEEDKSVRAFFDLMKYNLSNTVNYFNDKSNIQEIQKEILNFKTLLRDMIKTYIIAYCLTVRLNSLNINGYTLFGSLKIGEKMLCRISISNKSNFIFGNLELNLSIKPKKRIDVNILKKPIQKELKKNLTWEFELTGKLKGKTTILIQLKIENPFKKDNSFTYKRKIGNLKVNTV